MAFANRPQLKGLMKHFIAVSSLVLVSTPAVAVPAPAAVQACLAAQSLPGGAHYQDWEPNEFFVTDDEHVGRSEVIRKNGNERVGIWTHEKSRT